MLFAPTFETVRLIVEPEGVSVVAPDGSSLLTAESEMKTSGSAHSIRGSLFKVVTTSPALLVVIASSSTSVRIPAPIA